MTQRLTKAQRSAAMGDIAAGLVDLEGGRITLKDEGSGRRWRVDLPPFRIGRFPVTQAQYALIGQAPLPSRDEGNRPIVDVSWEDAIRFCNELSRASGLPECYHRDASGEVGCDWDSAGYRLPSEAEWELACRAGDPQPRYGPLDEIAWYRGNSGERLHPVGEKAPNRWGLHDMIGNVWEWCWDVYDPTVYGPYRVFRGGGWCDPPRGCRASCRRKSHPTFRIDDLGFRLAQSIR